MIRTIPAPAALSLRLLSAAVRATLIPLALTMTCAPVGCGDDTDADDEKAESREPREETDRVYAFKRFVPGPNDSGSMYVSLTTKLDVPADSLPPEKSREVFGDLVVFGDSMFVNDGPKISKYDVDADLEWQDSGTVSFVDYPLPEGANFFFMTQIDDDTVYMQFDGDKRLIWNPIDLSITGVAEDSSLPSEIDGLPLRAAGNGNYIEFKDRAWLLYDYMDEEWFEFAASSYAVSFDPETNEESSVLELPCPGIDTATQDEQGNTYFSTGSYTGLLHLYDKGPKPCLVRVTPEGALDEGWTTDMLDLTDGRYPTMFEYARDGFAVMNVLHHEGLGANFESTEIPADVIDSLWSSEHWKVWLVDLKANTARPLDELGDMGGQLGQGSVRHIDGRAFLYVGYDDRARTKIFEVLPDGMVEEVDDFANEGLWQRLR